MSDGPLSLLMAFWDLKIKVLALQNHLITDRGPSDIFKMQAWCPNPALRIDPYHTCFPQMCENQWFSLVFEFPDMLCIEGFYIVIEIHLVAFGAPRRAHEVCQLILEKGCTA